MEKRIFESTSLLNRFINEDRERYMVYKTYKERGVYIPQGEDIYLLELLDNMGFDVNKPGTYLFRELVSEIYGDVISSEDLGDYKSTLVLKDLNNERPFIYTVISNRLDIKPEGFYEYIYDATTNINKDCSDKLLRTTVLGANYNNQKPGMMAYNIAKYYEKFRRGEYKKPLSYGLVK